MDPSCVCALSNPPKSFPVVTDFKFQKDKQCTYDETLWLERVFAVLNARVWRHFICITSAEKRELNIKYVATVTKQRVLFCIVWLHMSLPHA
jgi:hypothetical protein